MKTFSLILLNASALAADLKPNAALTFDFPELPNTLAGMVSGTMKVARLRGISHNAEEGRCRGAGH